MTDQSPSAQSISVDIEAQYAAELRRKRDMTDADIAAEYPVRPTKDRIAYHRAADTFVRARRTRDAIDRAVGNVLTQASDAITGTFAHVDYDNVATSVSTLDLEGAVITVTIADLVATATLTIPVNDA